MSGVAKARVQQTLLGSVTKMAQTLKQNPRFRPGLHKFNEEKNLYF